jgi:ubiquinone biosynthesis protein COQ9
MSLLMPAMHTPPFELIAGADSPDNKYYYINDKYYDRRYYDSRSTSVVVYIT